MIVECNVDKVLVKTLGIPEEEIDHAFGKGRVCNKLRRGKDSKGLVDEDPGCTPPRYLQTLKLCSDEQNIKVFYDENSGNHLFMLCPNLEGWVLKATKKAGWM